MMTNLTVEEMAWCLINAKTLRTVKKNMRELEEKKATELSPKAN
jgi:hypothetical protein